MFEVMIFISVAYSVFIILQLLSLQAPLILIPQDSRSLSGLMVDLGQITIKNKFEMGQERNELGYPAIFDMINLQLQNVKISRSVIIWYS